jgi:chitin disaccharide deacetylase
VVRGIILTADDYGIAPGVGRAIRDLLEKGRVSATSCMVVFPDFPAEGLMLRHYLDRADIGLHLTLTHDRSLGRIMTEAFGGRLEAKAVTAEVDRQLALFERVVGRPPDFIDGHQHVHLMPVVRDAVVGAAARLGAYVRLTNEPLSCIRRTGVAVGKAALLSLLARALARDAGRRGLVCNRGFRGVRNFKEPEPFRALFQRMIANAPAGTIVMCHPGHMDEALKLRDGIVETREEEYLYLASKEFPADLAATGLQLARFKEALAGA